MQNNPATQAAESYFGAMIDAVQPWVPRIAQLFSAPIPPTRREVDAEVEELAAAVLTREGSQLVGAGFVAAPGVLQDARWHMAWWQGAKAERLLSDGEDAAGEAYARREWFVRPLEHGVAHLTGPYVDFLCTDEYTVTVTMPVVVAGRNVGVVGADVLAATLERGLGASLRDIAPSAALLNSHGRVIVSADPRVAAGTLMSEEAGSRIQAEFLGLSVVIPAG
jgi:hypothetical protein